MKIFYGVQATGNGHISRAMELLPHLQQYGEVDIFLSGDNSHLTLDAPVRYRSKGISLYYNCRGGLDYWQMIKGLHPVRLREEIRDLPVEKYNLVINDFDYITSAACARKKLRSIHLGHQASFQSLHTPRPVKKNRAGEWLLRHYVKSAHSIGFHFENYDDFVLGAVVKKDILEAEPSDENYITVYLPSYYELQLRQVFHSLPGLRFDIFSKEAKAIREEKNIRFLPVNKQLFNKSLINCSGIITGAGFETPAEALQLGKKIMAIPIRGQYEQQCNAAALQQMGVTTLSRIDDDFNDQVYNWLQCAQVIQKDYSKSIPQCLDRLFSLVEQRQEVEHLFEAY